MDTDMNKPMSEKASMKSKMKDMMKAKLSEAVKSEIKKDKVVKSIQSVKVDDGIIMASFSIKMPKENKNSDMGMDYTYEDFTKNFKTPEEFNAFVWDEFFNDFKSK